MPSTESAVAGSTQPARLLYVCKESFHHYKELDYRLLAERYAVERLFYRYRPGSIAGLVGAVNRADVVFTWFASPMAALAVLAARARGRGSIVVAGGYDVADYAPMRHGMAHRPVQKHFARFALERADIVLPVSRFTEGELCRFARPRRRETVYNAVDLPEAVPEVQRKAQAVTVGAVEAFYSELKGHHRFVEVARRLPSVRFVIAGPLKDATAERIRKSAPPNVELVGHVAHERLLELFAESAVYLQLSHYESFGLAVAEAMWCGCTPIVSDVAALPEVVGDSGHVVDPTDYDGIAKRVADRTRRPETDRQAMARARAFSVDRRRQALFRIVDDVVARRARGGGS